MIIEIEETVKAAAEKFNRGMAEHAGERSIMDCNHKAELLAELVDFFHYYQALMLKKKLAKMAPKSPKGRVPAMPTDEQVRDVSIGRMRKALKTINSRTGMLGDASMELTTMERLWVRALLEVNGL